MRSSSLSGVVSPASGTVASSSSTVVYYTNEQFKDLAKNKDKFYTCINYNVYEISDFVAHHPGGALIESIRSIDGTSLYEMHHPFRRVSIDDMMAKYKVGEIAREARNEFYAYSTMYKDIVDKLKSQGYDSLESLRNSPLFLTYISVIFCVFLFSHYLFARGFWLGTLLFSVMMPWIFMLLMHQLLHGSTQYKRVNKVLGSMLLDGPGASSYVWVYTHLNHHAFPNHHDDYDTMQLPILLRYRKDQPYKPQYKYQHIYAWGLYCFTLLSFVLRNLECLTYQFKQWRSNHNDRQHIQAYKFKHQLALPSFSPQFTPSSILLQPLKFLFFSLYFYGLPLYYNSLSHVLLHLVLIFGIGSFILSVMFQVNHLVHSMPIIPGQRVNPKRDWAVDQIHASHNFGTWNNAWNWMSGGLSYQTEHHLFPLSNHLFYPTIAKVVKSLCAKHHVQYQESPTFTEAIYKHYLLLKTLGQQP